MFPNHEGQPAPHATLTALIDGKPTPIPSAELFGPGRTVVVFALPGAFTPTCSSAHVPRYEELSAALRKAGVDEIVCLSVNDAFVMDAWSRDQGAQHIRFLADGNGEFTDAMGLLVDKSAIGFGKRSWRYSMLVRDGVIEKQFIEPDLPGDPYQVSDADTMLAYLAPTLAKQPDVLLFTKQGCGHCRRAKAALAEANQPFHEVPATPGMLRAVSTEPLTPRVFIDGQLIGGADELTAWIARRA